MDGRSSIDTNVPVLAVLPFVAGEGIGPVVSEGLYEDICRELTRFRSLRVVSPASAVAVADLTDAEIGVRLRASHVLRGRLRRRGARLQLAVTLSDAPRQTQVWQDSIETGTDDVFALEDELVARLAATLSARLEEIARAAGRRGGARLEVVSLVLQGRALLREGSPTADAEARAHFERAIELDPACPRAHAGLASSWFNEWSCQFWDRFEENGRLAYAHAHRALALDDSDAFLHQVVGKVCLFRRDFERASWYFDRALALCPNDAELLASQAFYEGFLGRPDLGIAHVERAMRLNPYHPPYYFGFAAFGHLLARRAEEAVALIERADGLPNVDVPAYWAAAYAHAGRLDEARTHFEQFRSNYRDKIACGRQAVPGEELRWFVDMNPLRRPEDIELFLDAFRRIGAAAARPAAPRASEATLLRAGTGWIVNFAGKRALLPRLKGLDDIRALLERPETEVHCLDLAGRDVGAPGDAVLDDRARTLVKARIRDLQEDLADAEDANDLGRAERVREELDRLIASLAAALGLGGRSRRLGDVVEKARTAVTWRIRHAIRRIEPLHPVLGRHLANSVRTGTFCVYRPEAAVVWSVSEPPQLEAV